MENFDPIRNGPDMLPKSLVLPVADALRDWRAFGDQIVALDLIYGGKDAVVHDLAERARGLLDG